MPEALVQEELGARARYLVKTQGVDIDAAMDTTKIKENVRGRRWMQAGVYIHMPNEGGLHLFYWSNHLTIYQEDATGKVLHYWGAAIESTLRWFRDLMILDDLARI